MTEVEAMLHDAAKLYGERAKEYGDSYKSFGDFVNELVGGHLTVSGPIDFARLGVLVHILTKLHRYVNNFEKGGHDDSLKDLAVYAMMLRELDNDRRKVAQVKDMVETLTAPPGTSLYRGLGDRVSAAFAARPAAGDSLYGADDTETPGRSYGDGLGLSYSFEAVDLEAARRSEFEG